MPDFFEIDFLDVESDKSGDAIPIHYQLGGVDYIHVVDGGFQDTGDSIVSHIRNYYANPPYVDHVVVTHPDGDHAGGLRTVLEELLVGKLWMLRPWLYADQLLYQFPRFQSAQSLAARLKEIYPNLAALEEIALRKGIAIGEPFQGVQVGAFVVMAPTKPRFLDLIVNSEKTPESRSEEEASPFDALANVFEKATLKIKNFIKAAWGDEVFSTEETSAENEMSVIQFAVLNGEKILLTGDAGREGLAEAAAYAPYVGLSLPGINRFQVPHHGSRRNVSTELLDQWLGPRLSSQPVPGEETFTAIVSSAKKDTHHPRRAVVRALIHRGAKVITTEGINIRVQVDAPAREGWSPVQAMSYPADQEE